MNANWLTCLIMALSLLTSSAPAYAKNSGQRGDSPNVVAPAVVQDTSDAKLLEACERLLVDYKSKMDELEAKDRLTKAQAQQIEAYKAKAEALESIAAQWKEVAELRAKAIGVDDKLVAKYDEQIRDLKADLARVMSERDTARHRNFLFGIGGALLGALLTAVLLNANDN